MDTRIEKSIRASGISRNEWRTMISSGKYSPEYINLLEDCRAEFYSQDKRQGRAIRYFDSHSTSLDGIKKTGWVLKRHTAYAMTPDKSWFVTISADELSGVHYPDISGVSRLVSRSKKIFDTSFSHRAVLFRMNEDDISPEELLAEIRVSKVFNDTPDYDCVPCVIKWADKYSDQQELEMVRRRRLHFTHRGTTMEPLYYALSLMYNGVTPDIQDSTGALCIGDPVLKCRKAIYLPQYLLDSAGKFDESLADVDNDDWYKKFL